MIPIDRQLKQILVRLKQPSVILSLASQLAALFILFGFDINEDLVLATTTIVCSCLVTLGILSNPDTETKGYGDDMLYCKTCGRAESHVKVGDQMVCKICGEVHGTGEIIDAELLEAILDIDDEEDPQP